MLYSHVALLMLRVLTLVKQSAMNLVNDVASRMHVAHIEGDVLLGCLFPIHRQIAGTDSCGEIWEQYGIQRTEIALETVRQINKRAALPFRLGISVRDSCWSERTAMEQTIAFIRDVLGHSGDQCCADQGGGGGGEACATKQTNLAAVVGPGKSSTSIAVQNLLQVFRMPQIGYSATSTDLTNKEEFGYYLRVVPSDVWQARAMLEIVKRFGWTYIAVVYSAGNYGEKGFEELQHFIEGEKNICIAISEKIKSLAEPKAFDALLTTIAHTHPRPQVAICFCEGQTIRSIFQAVKRSQNSQNRNANDTSRLFQWIGSDAWADRQDVVEHVEEEAAGSFSMRIHSPKVESFESYYFGLTPASNMMNPWFREFWEQKFKCRVIEEHETESDAQSTRTEILLPECTGKENLTLNFEQDPKLSQVINAIQTVAIALKSMHKQLCGDQEGLCPAMVPVNGTLLFRHMMNVTFTDQFNQEIFFDKNGDPPPWYDVLNYRGREGFTSAGEFRQYRNGHYGLSMIDQEQLMFYDKTDDIPESVCSHPCGIGQIRKVQTSVCCWHCIPCAENQITIDLFTCENCQVGMWPNANRTSCYPLEVEYLRWSHPAAILAMTIASVGILTTAITMILFIRFDLFFYVFRGRSNDPIFFRHNMTPVVKATTRELSYIILVGIGACYAMTFIIIARPTMPTCFVARTVPGLAFAMIYGALLTKTNRIARILAGSKKRILTKKPRFLSTMAQVVITWLLVAVELVIVAAAVIQEMPEAGFDKNYLPQRMVLVCLTSSWAFLAPFGWDLFLISLCTLYAVKTRNLPENFNEAKFIGFTMYTTCIIWLAFITIYFGSPNKAITMCLSFSLSATVALVLLFIPKLYIIVFHPEKNVRASYTTTKVIRCHFGNTPSTGGGTVSGVGASALDSRHVSRTLSSKVSNRMSVQSSSGSTSGSEFVQTATGEARRRPSNFRDSVHVPIPKGSVVSTARISAAVVDEEQDGSSRLASCRRTDGELSIIEESVNSRRTQRSSPASLSCRSSASQTDQSLLDDLLRSLENPDHLGLLRVPLHPPIKQQHAARTGGHSAAARTRHSLDQPKRALSMTVKQRRRGRSSNEHDEDEVLDLIDSCRRYQEEKALEHHGSHSPLLRKSSSDEELLHLLDRPVILPSPVVSGDENSSESESENRRDSSHLSSMLADSIGSSLRTFVGTAVPTETKEAILRRASEDQLAVRQRAEGGRSHHARSSLITNTLESTIDTVVPTALQRVPETSHESEPKSNSDSPPVSARGSSVLNRLSYSIKRKMQRMTNPANDASPPPSPRSFRTSIDDRAADLPPPATPTRARQSSSASAQQVQTQLSQPEQESDTADSGVLIRGSSRKRSGRSDASNIQPMRQATSDLESSKYSSKHSSMSSKHGSGKSKSKTAPSDVTPEESRKELSDESFHRLLHSQGLELTDLTESTLV